MKQALLRRRYSIGNGTDEKWHFPEKSHATVMHLQGHSSAHFPQRTHFSGRICAQPFSTIIASYSQFFLQRPQPMQASMQTSRAVRATSVLRQRTMTLWEAGKGE